MNLNSLEISGFRAFPESIHLDLSADTIIVVGANGYGKTSILDAILWGLCGSVPRIAGGLEAVLSRYSETGEAVVSVGVRSADDSVHYITRRTDGKSNQTTVTTDGQEPITGQLADTWIFENLWPEALQSSSPAGALTDSFVRGIYLQQDKMREFLEADDDDSRFSIFAELVGIGRVSDLQLALDRGRTAWSRATNAQDREVERLRQEVASLRSQLGALTPAEESSSIVPQQDSDLDSIWNSWWSELGELGVSASQVPPTVPAASSSLDAAVRQLDELLNGSQRNISRIQNLSSDLDRSTAKIDSAEESEAQQKLEEIESELRDATELLSVQEHQASVRRAALVTKRQDNEELASLAQLALRHLGSTCPVCTQEYDRGTAESNLRQLISRVETPLQQDSAIDEVARTAERIKALELDLRKSRTLVGELKEVRRNASTFETELRSRFEEIGLEMPEVQDRSRVLIERLQEYEQQSQRIRQARATGERLSLAIARLGESARRQELDSQLVEANMQLANQESVLQSRQETRISATRILEALRAGTVSIVVQRLESMESLVQGIYSRIDPHPTFQSVSLLARSYGGRGQLSVEVGDLVADKTNENPMTVLSSSQINALAVTLFLSTNFSMTNPPIDAVILDDPMQSLDAINVLGLIDLLRRTRGQRQMIISTHDERVGALLARKLRPTKAGQSTNVIEIVDWGRGGPIVRQKVIERDSRTFWIAA